MSGVWTQFAVFISNDSNHYTTGVRARTRVHLCVCVCVCVSNTSCKIAESRFTLADKYNCNFSCIYIYIYIYILKIIILVCWSRLLIIRSVHSSYFISPRCLPCPRASAESHRVVSVCSHRYVSRVSVENANGRPHL